MRFRITRSIPEDFLRDTAFPADLPAPRSPVPEAEFVKWEVSSFVNVVKEHPRVAKGRRIYRHEPVWEIEIPDLDALLALSERVHSALIVGAETGPWLITIYDGYVE